MSLTIEEAIARIPVRPGQPYRAHVNGQEIEVRVIDSDTNADVPSGGLWLDVSPSPAARCLTVRRGPKQLPAPLNIGDQDLAPA